MKILTPVILALSMTLLSVSCATPEAGQEGERASELQGTRCFDICGSQFMACSQDPNNDMSSCSDQRNQCEVECRQQKADEERNDDEGMVVPPDEMMEDIDPEEELSDEEIEDEVVEDPLEGEGVTKEENEN